MVWFVVEACSGSILEFKPCGLGASVSFPLAYRHDAMVANQFSTLHYTSGGRWFLQPYSYSRDSKLQSTSYYQLHSFEFFGHPGKSRPNFGGDISIRLESVAIDRMKLPP